MRIILENEPFSTYTTTEMSGLKRTFSTDDNSPKTDTTNEHPESPHDSPSSKKFRRTSSTSEAELETQIIEQENGIVNGKINSNH